eukprot:scaffold17971_cov43-Phaeocystis_antarctica.AAC.1
MKTRASLPGRQSRCMVFRKRDPKTATFSRDPGPVPSRTRRLLSDPLARTSYGRQDGTWSSSPDGQGAMKTSRPVDARL